MKKIVCKELSADTLVLTAEGEDLFQVVSRYESSVNEFFKGAVMTREDAAAIRDAIDFALRGQIP